MFYLSMCANAENYNKKSILFTKSAHEVIDYDIYLRPVYFCKFHSHLKFLGQIQQSFICTVAKEFFVI